MSLHEHGLPAIPAYPPILLSSGNKIEGFRNVAELNRELLAALRIIDEPFWGTQYASVWVMDPAEFMAVLEALEESPLVESVMLIRSGGKWLVRLRDAETLVSSCGCDAKIEIALAVAVIAFANRR